MHPGGFGVPPWGVRVVGRLMALLAMSCYHSDSSRTSPTGTPRDPEDRVGTPGEEGET